MDIPYSESLDRREGATTKNFGGKLEQSGIDVVMELSFVPPCSSSSSQERKRVPELHRINEGQAEWIIISLVLSLYISVVFSAFASAN